MGLELSQLENLRVTPSLSLEVAYLPVCVGAHLDSPLRIAYLTGRSLDHILEKHPKTNLLEMLCLPQMIVDGLWVADRPKGACVIYVDPATGKTFKSAVKCVAGYEVYIETFHTCRKAQIASIQRRGEILQVQR